MNTEELLDLDPVAVPWYDTVETAEPPDDLSLDEMVAGAGIRANSGAELLSKCSFTDGRKFRIDATVRGSVSEDSVFRLRNPDLSKL
jgi:hypothetical protein